MYQQYHSKLVIVFVLKPVLLIIFHKFGTLLQRRKPYALSLTISERGMRAVIVAIEPVRHFFFQFLKRGILQVIIKTFLVGSMRTLDFPVVARRAGFYKFVLYAIFSKKFINYAHRCFLCYFRRSTFRSVIGLYDCGQISEVHKRPFKKVYG